MKRCLSSLLLFLLVLLTFSIKSEATTETASQKPSSAEKPVGAKSGEKGGIYVAGRAFKSAGHSMEKGFKAAGRGMEKGFKKAGRSMHDFFTGEKSEKKEKK